MNQDIFEGVLGVFLSVFEASSKVVLKQFQGSFQRVSSKFLGVSWKFQECFKRSRSLDVDIISQRKSVSW